MLRNGCIRHLNSQKRKLEQKSSSLVCTRASKSLQCEYVLKSLKVFLGVLGLYLLLRIPYPTKEVPKKRERCEPTDEHQFRGHEGPM